jgi:hypothetical protein
MSERVVVDIYEAVGGPEKPGKDEYGLPYGPTDAGTYVFHGCGPHSSPTYKKWSTIPWGSKLKFLNGEILVKYKGKWIRPQDINRFGPTTQEILNQHYKPPALGGLGLTDFPSKWVYNDFGHTTCKFFRDVNKNRKLDKGEHIHSEYVHTTPDNEAQFAKGEKVELYESHGCIHVKPADIDDMIHKGYMRKGNSAKVHKYNEKPVSLAVSSSGKPPFEVHFYPGAQKIYIVGRK